MSKTGRWTWTDGLPFFLAALYFLSLAPYGLNLDDEGTLLYQIYRTAVGHALYQDFHAGYTPGVYVLNAFLWQIFGVNALYLRWMLVLVNAGAVQLLYLLTRRVGAQRWPAALAAASYVALIPFYDGQFLAANIPYPIWYVVNLWLLGLWFLLRWWETDRLRWCLLLGAAGGVVFWFKPNSGILACGGYLAAMATMVVVQPGPEDSVWSVRCARVVRTLTPWLVVLGVFWMLASAGDRRDFIALWLPVAVFVALVGRIPQEVRRLVPVARVWAYACAFAAGFAVVTLPWVVPYWSRLGTRAFLRAVLFIGTNFERFYYIPYPSLSRFGLAMVAVLAVFGLLVLLVRSRLLRREAVWGALGLGFVAAALYLWSYPPPMVEGWSASVTLRVRDISFVLALATLWWGMAVALWRVRRLSRSGAWNPEHADLPHRLARQQAALVVVLFGALTMHVQLYPRADFMHLVPAAPGLLVVGGWLLSRAANRTAVVLWPHRRQSRYLAFAFLLPLALVVLSMVFPGLRRAAYVTAAEWSGDRTALVHLGHARAPLVIEPAAGRLFLSLRDTASYLSQHSEPGEFVFPFPVLDIVCFLADRHNPTRHGYFFPGWPGHAVEAEVLDALRLRPPRWVVTLHDHSLFFATAPVYFFNLRRHITESYTVHRQIGVFDLLRPVNTAGSEFEVEEPEPMLSLWRRELEHRLGKVARETLEVLAVDDADWVALSPRLASASEEVRAEFARLVRKSRSPEAAATLAEMLAYETNGSRSRELAIRALAEVGDARSVPALLRAYESRPDLRSILAGLLFHAGSKLGFEAYWFTGDEVSVAPKFAADPRLLADWMDDPFESFALRSFAVRAAGHLGDPALLPPLVRLLGDQLEWRDLSAQAADALAALDRATGFLPAIVALFSVDRVWAPAVVAQHWSRENTGARGALEWALTVSDVGTRSVAYWVAAGLRDPALQTLLEHGLEDPEAEVRMGAAWGLGELGERAAVGTLERALRVERNDEVERFIRGALRKLGAF